MALLAPPPYARVASAPHLLAAAAAQNPGILPYAAHLRLTAEPSWVRRVWSQRTDIPAELASDRVVADPDWVVRARLLGAPSLGFDEVVPLLARIGPRPRPVAALRPECPDDLGAALLDGISECRWTSMYYALLLARDRAVSLSRRPLTVRSVLRDSTSYVETGLLAHLLVDESSQEPLLERLEDALALNWTMFSVDGQHIGFEYLYHQQLPWLSARTGMFHEQDCFVCDPDRPPAQEHQLGSRWHAPSVVAVMCGVLDDVSSLYATDAGDVLCNLLNSKLPFIKVMEATCRLTGDAAARSLLDEASRWSPPVKEPEPVDPW